MTNTNGRSSSPQKARIAVCGGGTGGHLYPALAVAQYLKTCDWVDDVLFIGNQHRSEATIVPDAGIAFEGIVFSGMPRKWSIRFLGWILALIKASFHCQRLLRSFKPDMVFATGGYVTGPVLIAAKKNRIPFIVHEPDAHPGLVNRKFGPWAKTITCAFEASVNQFHHAHVTATGNPLRADIGHMDKSEALAQMNLDFNPDKPVLLVTGGSQGAQQINTAVLEALPTLIDTLGLQILHQTGEKTFQMVQENCPEAFQNHTAYKAVPFISGMAAALAISDIALCRSGSMSLSEMYRAHMPTILVPYPYASGDHQKKNALTSQEAGASIMIEDAHLNGNTLIQALETILKDSEKQTSMQTSAKALSRPEATQAIASLIQQTVGEAAFSTYEKTV